MAHILVVDDERSMCEFLGILLKKDGHRPVVCSKVADAVAVINKTANDPFEIVLSDLRLPDGSGMDILRHLKETNSEAQFIMMTAYATLENAIKAMKAGAYDYQIKPFKVDEIRFVINKALEKSRLILENLALREELQQRHRFGRLLGKSGAMKEIFELVELVAATRTSVLLCGESGTGKELVAQAIHEKSPRHEGPFVAINCAAIPEPLIESELFGFTKGSHSTAHEDKIGLFEAAQGGSLFLDEVGDLPPATQAKLLRVLQERRVKPVGGVKETSVDVRIISATNCDLEGKVSAGQFREDLFYRLNVVKIDVPSLRERREDIPLLAEAFLKRFATESGKRASSFTSDCLEALLSYDYPGNVRELENIVERAVTLSSTEQIPLSALPPALAQLRGASPTVPHMEITEKGIDLEQIVSELEENLIRQALTLSQGVQKKAAQLLGLTFRSLRYRLEKYRIKP